MRLQHVRSYCYGCRDQGEEGSSFDVMSPWRSPEESDSFVRTFQARVSRGIQNQMDRNVPSTSPASKLASASSSPTPPPYHVRRDLSSDPSHTKHSQPCPWPIAHRTTPHNTQSVVVGLLTIVQRVWNRSAKLFRSTTQPALRRLPAMGSRPEALLARERRCKMNS